MNQENYNAIIKTLQFGAPALANELIASINNLLAENNKLTQELLDLRRKSEVVKDEDAKEE